MVNVRVPQAHRDELDRIAGKITGIGARGPSIQFTFQIGQQEYQWRCPGNHHCETRALRNNVSAFRHFLEKINR